MRRAHPYGPSIQVSEQLMAKILPMTSERISHFSTLETCFFKEGDDISNWLPTGDESDEPTRICRSRRWYTRRWPWFGAAIGIACVISLALLGRSHRKTAPELVESAAPQPEESTTLAPVATAQPAKVPAGVAAEMLAQNSAGILAPAPVADLPLPSASQATTGAVAATRPQEDAFETCRKAFDQHRAKDVLSTCPQAIDATPPSAELAVMLARTEFERGRARQALDWAKKAVALDAERADAYVYLGGAEQAVGRAAAAKAAYRRYLRLAPQGRHAADLRAVLSNL
jgi:tetratricopeptide (TPR) repeat protein